MKNILDEFKYLKYHYYIANVTSKGVLSKSLESTKRVRYATV